MTMADEVNESGSNERPSVQAYRRWTSAVVKMVASVEPVGDGYRFGPLEVGVDPRHGLVAPLGIDPGEIPGRLDHVAAMVRDVHDSAVAAAGAIEAALRELGVLASGAPAASLERVAMLRSFAANVRRAASADRWWHPEAVLLVLCLRDDIRKGDPRIPVTVIVYI